MAVHFPGIGTAEPVVGAFDLPATADFLTEYSVLIAQAVTDGGDFERGQGIHEARGQPSEAAVAEAGVVFPRPPDSALKRGWLMRPHRFFMLAMLLIRHRPSSK